MKKVLICEDNDDLSTLLRIALERDGYCVDTVEDMDRFLFDAVVFEPDLILMDLRMPKVSGEEAVATLRADERTAHIPVVLVSANREIGAIAKRLDVPYLSKPFQLRDLRDVVAEVVPE